MTTHTFLCTSRQQAEAIASKSSRGIMSVAGGGNTTSVILNETCFERYSIFFGIPYLLFPDRLTSPTNPITGIRDDNIQLWIHIGLLAICLIQSMRGRERGREGERERERERGRNNYHYRLLNIHFSINIPQVHWSHRSQYIITRRRYCSTTDCPGHPLLSSTTN